MANTFVTPEQRVNAALGILDHEVVLPRLVTRSYDSAFNGKIGDTINVNVPARVTARDYEWRTRNADIVTDDLTETSYPLELDKHPYSAIRVTDEELTLDIADFGAQVLEPQMRAVAEKLESYLATEIEGATYETSLVMEASEPWDTIINARKALNDANVPRGGRVLLVGSAVEAAVLKDPDLKRVDDAGSDSVLRDATVGRLGGFTVVGSNAINENHAYAFHPSAYVLATVAPVVPSGVAEGARSEFAGLAMRWIRDYETARLRDRSVVSAFAGTLAVEDDSELVRSVKISLNAAS